MIVTSGGKNIYPEDIEAAFDGLPAKEFCVFAVNYLWPQKMLGNEMLVLVVRLEQSQQFESDRLFGEDCHAESLGCRISSASAAIWYGRKIFRGPHR